MIKDASTQPIIAAIEAGGTKFNCACMALDGTLIEQIRIPTTAPDETLPTVVSFYRQQLDKGNTLEAIGIGSFGPLDLNPSSNAFGAFRNTPKTPWQGINILKEIESNFDAPVFIDTDVNAAAIAERRYGAARGADNFCYVTVGTGIGVGVIMGGTLLAGTDHLEIGHMQIKRAPGDEFEGCCPFHSDCLEGLASGTAMKKRWNTPPHLLEADHIGWTIEADYLASLCMNLSLSFRPEMIVLGGGVFGHEGLLPRVREKFVEKLKGYISMGRGVAVEDYIRSAQLAHPPAGIMGAYLLAESGLKYGNQNDWPIV